MSHREASPLGTVTYADSLCLKLLSGKVSQEHVQSQLAGPSRPVLSCVRDFLF